MTTDKVTIDRELLERLACEVVPTTHQELLNASDDFGAAIKELRAILAAPRQPEGETISRERVQAEADAFFDWPTTDKSSVTTTSCLIFARCIAGMVAAERDATIAELREGCERLLKITSVTMGVGSGGGQLFVHGDYDSIKAAQAIVLERDTLRQQLAERDAEILEQCRLNGMGAERELKLIAQRDKLAGLLREALKLGELDMVLSLRSMVIAALAEVNK